MRCSSQSGMGGGLCELQSAYDILFPRVVNLLTYAFFLAFQVMESVAGEHLPFTAEGDDPNSSDIAPVEVSAVCQGERVNVEMLVGLFAIAS